MSNEKVIKKQKISKKEKRKKRFGDFLFFVWVIIITVIFNMMFVMIHVPTESMYPTIKANSINLGMRVAYKLREPMRGDIIAFENRTEELEEKYLFKRIIGLPGETIEVKEGEVYVNGRHLLEEYLNTEELLYEDIGPFQVPEGHYFVMGDNRNHSYDSRYWHDPYVAKEDILAKNMMSLPLPSFESAS